MQTSSHGPNRRLWLLAGMLSIIGCSEYAQDVIRYSNKTTAALVATGDGGVLAIVNVETNDPSRQMFFDYSAPFKYAAAYRLDGDGGELWVQEPIEFRGLALEQATIGERKQEGHFIIAGENHHRDDAPAVIARLDSIGTVLDVYPLTTLAPFHKLYGTTGPEFLMFLYSDHSLRWYLKREHFMDRSVTEGPLLLDLPADEFGALAINRNLECIVATGTENYGSCVIVADGTLDILWTYDTHEIQVQSVAWHGEDAVACGVQPIAGTANRELILIRRSGNREVSERVLYSSPHLQSAPLLHVPAYGDLLAICVTSEFDSGDLLLVGQDSTGAGFVSPMRIPGKQTPTCVLEFEDGTLMIGGGRVCDDTGDQDAFVMRVSQSGEVIWYQTIAR